MLRAGQKSFIAKSVTALKFFERGLPDWPSMANRILQLDNYKKRQVLRCFAAFNHAPRDLAFLNYKKTRIACRVFLVLVEF